MSKTKKQIATAILCALSIAVLLWVIASTVAVWTGDVGKGNLWGMLAANETETTVTACVKSQGDSYWTVFVTDAEGNEWSYYDDTYRETGTTITTVFHGNAIIDVR